MIARPRRYCGCYDARPGPKSRELFDVLCKQAGRGLRVRLAVLNDRINVGAGRVNFQRLQDIGGEVFLAAQWSADSGSSLSHGLAAVLLMAQASSATSGFVFVQCTFENAAQADAEIASWRIRAQ